MQSIHLNIYFSIQLINSFSSIYKNFKMINITYMISILNSVFTVVFYMMRWTKQDHIYICYEEILNQLNLLYIYICLYLYFIFTIVFYATRLTKKISITYVLNNFKINLIWSIFTYVYIHNKLRVMSMWANESHSRSKGYT
jgi:hypothetical protein